MLRRGRGRFWSVPKDGNATGHGIGQALRDIMRINDQADEQMLRAIESLNRVRGVYDEGDAGADSAD
jgi:hypothetical protein